MDPFFSQNMDLQFLSTVDRLTNSLHLVNQTRQRLISIYNSFHPQRELNLRLLFYTNLNPSFFQNSQDLIRYLNGIQQMFQTNHPRNRFNILRTYGDILFEDSRQRINITPSTEYNRPTQTINQKDIKELGKEEYPEPEEHPECAICLEGVTKRKGGRLHSYKDNNLKVNHCGHIFHRKCLRQMLETPGSSILKCPVCRAKIDAGSTFFGKGSFISILNYLKRIK